MIIVITGPTCTGKSETALVVAKARNAFIVNADAFQLYKQLNIGVAKPPKEYFEEVPHYFYSCVDIEKEYSIADYQNDIRKVLNELEATGKDIVLVGGSGLYIRSALYDYVFDEQTEKVDMSKFEKLDNHALHEELKKIDPVEAEKIHENNRKRVLRAIEIFLSMGERKSDIIASQEHRLMYNAKFFVRDVDRDELYKKIDKRVDEMMKQGLFDEVKTLVSKYGKNLRALQAIGYKELISVLDGSETLENAVNKIKKNSRNYAKRQLTFIKHQFPSIFYKDTEDLLEKLK